MATLPNILSPVWTLSTTGGGSIAEGLTAIKQCISTILRTTPGSDPLRPTFGSDVYKYIDAPVTAAAPSIKKAIFDAIAEWEPRVKITKIAHQIDGSNIILSIGYKLVDTNLEDSLSISIGNGGIYTEVARAQLVLRGYFPPNPSAYQYSALLILDDQVILPLVPDAGFSTLQDLFNWIKDKWVNYGLWYFTPDSIVGFINPKFKTGSFALTVLSASQFKGIIPVLPNGNKYDAQITVDGSLYESDTDLLTADNVRQWAQNILGNLGNWQIIYTAGEFNEDFNDDFDVYEQYLTIDTNLATTITINISTVTA